MSNSADIMIHVLVSCTFVCDKRILCLHCSALKISFWHLYIWCSSIKSFPMSNYLQYSSLRSLSFRSLPASARASSTLASSSRRSFSARLMSCLNPSTFCIATSSSSSLSLTCLETFCFCCRNSDNLKQTDILYKSKNIHVGQHAY